MVDVHGRLYGSPNAETQLTCTALDGGIELRACTLGPAARVPGPWLAHKCKLVPLQVPEEKREELLKDIKEVKQAVANLERVSAVVLNRSSAGPSESKQ